MTKQVSIPIAILLSVVLGTGAFLALYKPKDEMLPSAQKSDGNTQLLAFGDSGTGSSEQKKLAKLMDKYQFDAVIHTGDLAYESGQKDEIKNFFTNIYSEKIKSRFYPTLGNHDYATNNGQPYLDSFKLPAAAINPNDNERYYSVDINNVHLVSLDSNLPLNQVTAKRQDDMADWLEQDLKRANGKVIIVFFHHPPFTAGKQHSPDERVQTQLIPILDKYKVRLVLNGHEHSYQRTCLLKFSTNSTNCLNKGGTTYVITGGGGGPLYEVSESAAPYFLKLASLYHFLEIVVDNDGNIKLKAIGLNNQTIDELEL